MLDSNRYAQQGVEHKDAPRVDIWRAVAWIALALVTVFGWSFVLRLVLH